MLKSYINIAVRNLLKNKLHSGINILGLSIGMAVAILVILYIRNELSYDKWIANHQQVYRIYRSWTNGGQVTWTPGPLAKTLREDFPEVVSASGLAYEGETLMEKGNKKLYIERVAFADSTFLQVVELPLLYGNPVEVFKQPRSIVLSKKVAEMLLGPGDVIGQTVKVNGETDYTVSGVLAPLQGNTHLDYDAYAQIYWDAPSWTGNNRATYVLLGENVSPDAFSEKITPYINQFLEREFLSAGRKLNPSDFPTWNLQPLSNVHIQSAQIRGVGGTDGNIKYLYIFGIIGLLVLFIAGINYINLSTARAAQRAREVGVRKVTGAFRKHLVGQFLLESVVQSLFAMTIALALAEMLLPGFNAITQRELRFFSGEPQTLIVPLLALAVFIGLLAGVYPAFFLSRYRPVSVLKGKVDKGQSGQLFRRALVVTQFSLTVVLIIVMTFIFRQVNFMMKQDLGFTPEQVMVVPMNKNDSYAKVERLREAFRQLEGVEEVATTTRVPGHSYPDWGVLLEGREDDYDPRVAFVGEGFDKTLGLEVAEGRFFSYDHAMDTVNAFVVNEAFVNQYHLEDPIGKRMKFTFDDEYGQIIGVMKDFNFRGLDRSITPLVLGANRRRWYTTFLVNTQNLDQTVKGIEALWARVEPVHPMRFSFLDEDFARQYDEQKRFGKAMLYAAVLAIFIAMLGLFGLAAFAAARRTKEIGIRKVLGASTSQVTLMLIRDFVRWVLIAGVIALPLAYVLTERWLADFAYRTSISPFPFVMAILLSLMVAILTVSFQSIRVALSNPIDALRYE